MARILLAGLAWLSVLLSSCAAPLPHPARSDAVRVQPPLPSRIRIELARPWQDPEQATGAAEATVPVSVLGSAGASPDDVVAMVGTVSIRKSDVYDRLLENDRRSAQLWIDLLVLDAVVAEMVQRYGVEVRADQVASLAEDEEDLLRTQHGIEWGERLSFDEFLDRQFGLSLEEYRRFLRADLARQGYRSLVMRYVGMLEDRVEVRFMVHEDPAVLEDAKEKVAAGADFAALVRRLSTDRSRQDGGLLGPFGRTFRHPIAAVAFDLPPGGLSEVFEFDDRGRTRHALVYCVRRLPGRDLPFAELREEVAADLERAPITAFEQSAFVMQYCRPTSTLDTTPAVR